MTGVVARIPRPVLASAALGGSRTYEGYGEGYDFALDGMPFNAVPSAQNPIIRQSAPVRKDQSDTSREPGEHSLAFWWLRSQSSFHGGAGQRYLGSADVENGGIESYRFWTSRGVDVFSEHGAVSLLRDTALLADTAGVTPLIATSDSGYLFIANGSTLTRKWIPFSISTGTVAWGGTDPILALVVNGSSYYLATENGVWAGTTSSLGAATKIYDLPASSQPTLAYVKQRLILSLNRFGSTPSAVYELDPSAAAGTALPTPIFAAVPGWRWTAVTETPAAILISGHNWMRSAVYKMALDTSGIVPVLAPGVVSAEFPPLELVTNMTSYLGTVVGVQTTKGFRVGVLNDSGDFNYGPLLFEHKWDEPSSAILGLGDSLYVGWCDDDDVAGLARVDLTSTLGSGQSLRFPYAADLRARNGTANPTGAVTQAVLWDDEYQKKVFVVAGVGVFMSSGATVASGSITTSRIRWDTLEPKLLRFARVRGEGDYGQISLEVGRDSDQTFSRVSTIDLSERHDSGDAYVQMDPATFFTLRITITDGTLLGYQLKALPAQRKQRFITLPLAVYDRELSNVGQMSGGDGTALSRLRALEELEQTGRVAALQWLSPFPDQRLTEYVIVEGIEYQQNASPGGMQSWGGLAVLTLRTVD